MDFEIWVYRMIILAAAAIIWWVVRRWAMSISDKFDELLKAIQKMGEKDAVQDQRIGSLESRVSDHSKRIREIEQNV